MLPDAIYTSVEEIFPPTISIFFPIPSSGGTAASRVPPVPLSAVDECWCRGSSRDFADSACFHLRLTHRCTLWETRRMPFSSSLYIAWVRPWQWWGILMVRGCAVSTTHLTPRRGCSAWTFAGSLDIFPWRVPRARLNALFRPRAVPCPTIGGLLWAMASVSHPSAAHAGVR